MDSAVAATVLGVVVAAIGTAAGIVQILDYLQRRRKAQAASVAPTGAAVPPADSAIPTSRAPIAQTSSLPTSTGQFRRMHALPRPLTSFIGRETEIAEVVALLKTTRLLTLIGAGGSGKTRLALEVARRVRSDFADGVFFVALGSTIDPSLVPATLAQTLGVREAPSQPLLESLKGHLRDKEILLLLDNFEQVVEAAPLVAELLMACPRLKVLVTSRAVLHVSGEQEYLVPPLPGPDLRQPASVDALSQYAAVQLFVQRARDVRPEFRLTTENTPAVAEICARLDGLPLAIELAAARTKLLAPQALLTRLESRLTLLTGGAWDRPARQRTLRHTMRWSYDLLNDEEQMLFRRLAVFTGGCTLAAAEAVCADGLGSGEADTTLDLLASLVDNSLLQREEGPDGEPRFIMLETVREFAGEMLASGEADELCGRHARFYLALAEEAEPQLTSAARGPWLLRLEQEHGNLRAALAWSRHETDGGALRLRLAGALWWFWFFEGHLSEARAWLEGALALIGGRVRTPAYARALLGAGALALRLGDPAAARDRLEESVALWRELGDRRQIAYTLQILGLLALSQGEAATARARLQEGVALFREMGDRWGLAVLLYCLGDATIGADPTAARALYEESLTLSRQLGDPWVIAFPLTSLAHLALHEGDYATARARGEEALAMRRQLEDAWLIAVSLTSLGAVARCAGDDEQAAKLYEESLALHREVGNKSGIAWALHDLAYVARRRGEHRRAASLLTESLQLAQEMGERQRIAACLAGLAGTAAAAGDPRRAARLSGAAEALLAATGVQLDPAARADLDGSVAAVRAALGEEAFAAAQAAGRALTPEAAIAEALAEPALP